MPRLRIARSEKCSGPVNLVRLPISQDRQSQRAHCDRRGGRSSRRGARRPEVGPQKRCSAWATPSWACIPLQANTTNLINMSFLLFHIAKGLGRRGVKGGQAGIIQSRILKPTRKKMLRRPTGAARRAPAPASAPVRKLHN